MVPLTDLLTAFMLLTRLPVSRFAGPGARIDFPGCVWAFPVVGLVVSALGGLVYWLAHWLGAPPLAGAGWALAATICMTGALHEDGLADTADGFGGGASRVQKLEIMRDSRIGCYGALALLLSVVIRAGAIAALNDPHRVMLAMIVAGALGRGGMLVPLALLRPARDDGMGAAMGTMRPVSLAVGMTLAVVVSLLPRSIPMALAVVLAACVSLAMAKLAHSQIGGYTGDVLGACEVVIECVVLTVASVSLPSS